jgi:hypothetical protein
MAGLIRIIQIVATILQIVFEVQEVITGYVIALVLLPWTTW